MLACKVIRKRIYSTKGFDTMNKTQIQLLLDVLQEPPKKPREKDPLYLEILYLICQISTTWQFKFGKKSKIEVALEYAIIE